LLLLRASVSIALLLESLVGHHGLPAWITGASLLAAAALCIGFLTPIAAGVALALHALIWSTMQACDAGAVVVISLDAVALAVLGPGAYSIDSRRFGRHVVVLPPEP
jgi:uncharacterized membrane protein YphA (DoxX/SURF4 family)